MHAQHRGIGRRADDEARGDQHLVVGGLGVETRRDAQQVFYKLASDKVERVLETLYGIYCDPRARTAKGRTA